MKGSSSFTQQQTKSKHATVGNNNIFWQQHEHTNIVQHFKITWFL